MRSPLYPYSTLPTLYNDPQKLDHKLRPIIKTETVTQGPTGPNAVIWADKPALEQLSNQNYLGRVVIEVWNEGEFVFFENNLSLLDKTLVALQGVTDVNVLTAAPWTDEPVMGEAKGQTFLGRVVVEVWDRHAAVAVTGLDSPTNLAERAIDRLSRIL